MRKRTLRNLLSFLLVLVLTVCTVTALSIVTRAQTAATIPEVEESVQAAQITASVPSQMVASPLVCVGGFLAMLAIVAVGLAIYRREKCHGRETSQGKRRYIPKADMAFRGRSRV
ncbi:MAG: hypothetical protein ACOYJZ_02585 [Acutalibacter sp.]|jgi:hypothetical protein